MFSSILKLVQSLMFDFLISGSKFLLSILLIIFVLRYIDSISISKQYFVVKVEGCLAKKFRQAGYIFDLESIRKLTFGAILISVIFGVLLTPILGIILPLVLLGLANLFLEHKAKVRKLISGRVNDDVCFFLARNLRAGHSLDVGIIKAKEEFPGSKVLDQIYYYLRGGSSLLVAIDKVRSLEGTNLDLSEKTLCATISLAQEMGGNSARVFDRVGDTVHQSYELGEDIDSALAQVRMSVYIISFLPVVMFLFSFILGSGSTMYLFTRPLGWVCLVIGLSLELAGILWMKKMVDEGVKIWSY